MSIDKMLDFMPAPSNPVENSGSWPDVHASLGTPLPDDFKKFIEVYGSGRVGGFISIFNPFSSRPNLNLIEQAQRQLEALQILITEFDEPSPYQLFPDAGGILPIAITDNGDTIHWITSGEPNKWVVVVNESRSPVYEQYDCNFTTFLLKIGKRTIRCPVFPRSFPGEKFSFRSVPI